MLDGDYGESVSVPIMGRSESKSETSASKMGNMLELLCRHSIRLESARPARVLSISTKMRSLTISADAEFALTKDLQENIPAYAFLSRTWGEDEDDVTFGDIVECTGTNKAGYAKLLFCMHQAKQDGLEHIWVDKCCT